MNATRIVVRHGNIGRHATQAATRTNMARLLNAGPHNIPSADLLDEIDDDDQAHERTILADLRPHPDYTTFPGPHTGGALVPIVLSHHWDVLDQWADKVSDGIPRITPDRYLTTRVARLGTRPPLAFIGGQAIQGAFTDPGQPFETQRRELWAQWRAGLKATMTDLVNHGVTCIVGVDANHPRMPSMVGERRDMHESLDYVLRFTAHGRNFTALDPVRRQRVPGSIDGHNFQVVTYDVV